MTTKWKWILGLSGVAVMAAALAATKKGFAKEKIVSMLEAKLKTLGLLSEGTHVELENCVEDGFGFVCDVVVPILGHEMRPGTMKYAGGRTVVFETHDGIEYEVSA